MKNFFLAHFRTIVDLITNIGWIVLFALPAAVIIAIAIHNRNPFLTFFAAPLYWAICWYHDQYKRHKAFLDEGVKRPS